MSTVRIIIVITILASLAGLWFTNPEECRLGQASHCRD